MVLGVRDLGVSWLRPGQDSWSGEDSADVAQEGSDRRCSELGWARSSEPVPAGSHVWVRRGELKEKVGDDSPVQAAINKIQTHTHTHPDTKTRNEV